MLEPSCRRHLRHLRVRKKTWIRLTQFTTNTNSLVHACAYVYVCYIQLKKKGEGRGPERERERRGIETIRFRKLANQGSLVSSDVKAVCLKAVVYHIRTTKGRRETRSPGWVDDKRPLDQVSGSSVTRLSNKTSSPHGGEGIVCEA